MIDLDKAIKGNHRRFMISPYIVGCESLRICERGGFVEREIDSRWLLASLDDFSGRLLRPMLEGLSGVPDLSEPSKGETWWSIGTSDNRSFRVIERTKDGKTALRIDLEPVGA